MKILNITNPKAFFEVVEKCKGRVELVTSEGDRLNLKSKLCQYIAMSDMFTDAKIGEVEILVSDPEDASLMVDYLIRG